MVCFWTDRIKCHEDCTDSPPLFALYKNGPGGGHIGDTVDPFDLQNFCTAGGDIEIFGIVSGSGVLTDDAFSCCPIDSVNGMFDPPDSCDSNALILALSACDTDGTPFAISSMPYEGTDTWTLGDIGLTASGYGIYVLDTSAGDMLWIVVSHICY